MLRVTVHICCYCCCQIYSSSDAAASVKNLCVDWVGRRLFWTETSESGPERGTALMQYDLLRTRTEPHTVLSRPGHVWAMAFQPSSRWVQA